MHALIHYRRADGTPYVQEDCPIYRALQAGERAHVEGDIFWRADGSGFRVEYWSHPTRRGGGIAGAVVTFRDTGGRSERENLIRQTRKTDPVVQLAGHLAYELSNLLTVIYGYGDMVLASAPAGAPAHDLVRKMMAAAGRANVVTNKLEALSRTAIFHPEIVDLRLLVTKLDSDIRRIIGTGIHLTVSVSSQPATVQTDPNQIEQVILYLVANARDAMPRGGRLAIDVLGAALDADYVRTHPSARPGPHVVLAVSDSGCGIDPAIMARLFEPFVTTKGKGGTGLGLAIVNQIVKQSGGHVEIASEVGRGTTVEVYLPRV
jgi:two-component system, cell cycle sensor histidine kinase and response regulator CckA